MTAFPPPAPSGTGRRRLDQGYRALRGLVPLAARLVGLVRGFTVATAVAGAVLAAVVVWKLWPTTVIEVVVVVVAVAALSAPVVVLWLFGSALAEAVDLPRRLAATPDAARGHGTEVAALLRDAQGHQRRRLRTLPADLWRAGRLLLAANRDLPGYGSVLALVSPTFLLTSAAAALAGVAMLMLVVPVLVGAVLVTVV